MANTAVKRDAPPASRLRVPCILSPTLAFIGNTIIMKPIALVCTLLPLLVACDQQHSVGLVSSSSNNPPAIHYQIIANSEGGVWKVDTLSGEIKYCTAYSPEAKSTACFQAMEK